MSTPLLDHIHNPQKYLNHALSQLYKNAAALTAGKTPPDEKYAISICREVTADLDGDGVENEKIGFALVTKGEDSDLVKPVLFTIRPKLFSDTPSTRPVLNEREINLFDLQGNEIFSDTFFRGAQTYCSDGESGTSIRPTRASCGTFPVRMNIGNYVGNSKDGKDPKELDFSIEYFTAKVGGFFEGNTYKRVVMQMLLSAHSLEAIEKSVRFEEEATYEKLSEWCQ